MTTIAHAIPAAEGRCERGALRDEGGGLLGFSKITGDLARALGRGIGVGA